MCSTGEGVVLSALRLCLRDTRGAKRATLAVAGDIDIATADTLRRQLHDLADEGWGHIVVDLSQVGFCDCSGLSALVAGHLRAREHDPAGGLRLAEPQPVVATLLRTNDLTCPFGVYDTVTEAETAAAEPDPQQGRWVDR